jgi:hypothetical protein
MDYKYGVETQKIESSQRPDNSPTANPDFITFQSSRSYSLPPPPKVSTHKERVVGVSRRKVAQILPDILDALYAIRTITDDGVAQRLIPDQHQTLIKPPNTTCCTVRPTTFNQETFSS